MWKLALSLFTKLGGARAIGVAVVCLVPLILLQCSRSNLEDLREDYRALKSDNAALAANLQACRDASGLHDAVLTARERETIEITDKYNRLRDEFMRGLLAGTTEAASNEASDNEVPFPDWCAQPVPGLVRGLLTAPRAGSGLPAAPGGIDAGNPGAAAGQAGAKP